MAGDAGSVIRIRGLSSLSAGGDPLYVVTASPSTRIFRGSGTNSGGMNRNPLASFNPNDIKSVEVLEDMTATGIYGSRGANGVILITTKRGTRKGLCGVLPVELRRRPTYRPPQHAEHRGIFDHPSRGLGKRRRHGVRLASPTGTSALSSQARKLAYERALQTDTDWWDVFTEPPKKIEQNLSFRSGGEKWSMFNSVSISDNESWAPLAISKN